MSARTIPSRGSFESPLGIRVTFALSVAGPSNLRLLKPPVAARTERREIAKMRARSALAVTPLIALAVASCAPTGATTQQPAPLVAGKCSDPPASATPETPLPGVGTAEEATKFYARVDHDLKQLFADRDTAAWVSMTHITGDTERLAAEGEERVMAYLNQTLQFAKRFDGIDLPPDVARQRLLLKLAATTPAPGDAAKRSELANILASMSGDYGKAEYCPADAAKTKLKKKHKPGVKTTAEQDLHPCFDLGELEEVIDHSTDYAALTEAWKGWHDTGKQIKDRYAKYVELGNEGAKELGFADLGEYWRAGYDMTPQAFSDDVERLWSEVKPLYDELHCYVRAKLRKKYPEAKIAEKGAIPAHLLGNMWAQEWTNIYPLVEPYSGQGSTDVTKELVQKHYDEQGLVRLGEKFFTSLGLDPLPKTFWERSMFKKPTESSVVCHASAWDVTYSGDLRIKMCIKVDEENLVTVHHELGHDYYYMYYYNLPVLFQQGANDGFHEGIGDTLALSVTPKYLKDIGLADSAPDNPKAEVNHLMKMALEKVSFLPFGKVIDQYRWNLFAGKVKPGDYNKAWWDLRRQYQGIEPPIARDESDFDAGAKYHVPANTPYTRYFLARIYQFQFHRALCKLAGQTGPLSKCSIYGNKAAGAKLEAMLKMGASKPWPEALAALSGETKADAGALLEYFEPLRAFLKEQTKDEKCGF